MKWKWNRKSITILFICLIGGIIFLMLSEYNLLEQAESQTETFDETLYTEQLETRLAAIIGQMQGVSDVTVMITLEGGISYQYAVQTAKSLSGDSSSTETFLEMQEDSGGKSSPILTEVRLPAIKGVSVVCNGGSDANIRKRIIGLIASTLNLNENQIYVTQ